MIDTHAHILDCYYDNIDELTNLLKEKNIIYVLNASSNYSEALEIIDKSKKYHFLLPVIGIHPESVDEIDKLDKIEELIKNNKVYAVGEIGLDYHWVKDNKDKQKELFIKQIELANKYNLPIVVHTRDSISDVLEIIKEHKCRGVMHCFSGSYEMAKEFIKYGFKLGIGGVLTFKNSKLYKIVEELPIDSFVLETDSPYLAPEPKRGSENEPANVKYVAEFICKLKGILPEELAKITEKNLHEIFDI